MTSENIDAIKWRELVAAEQKVARLRADVNQLRSRTELLVDALSGSSTWDRAAAMTFLRLFPEDVPLLLDLLVEHSLSHGWAQAAWEAIGAARRDIGSAQLAEAVMRKLQDADAEDYLRLADMLTHVEAWAILLELIKKARSSSDPEIREVARDFTDHFGGMLPS